MLPQGGKVFIFILAVIIAGFFCAQKAMASQTILISEVQITGGSGKTENDFIELYNPGEATVNLKGYRLVKRTKTGTSDINIKSWTADALIPAGGYYLWANSGYADIAATPNSTTTAAISNDNGIAIRFGAIDTGIVIDSLAWGEAQNAFIEGQVFPANPAAGQSLERSLNSDTNDNSVDFKIQENSNPQNSGLAAAPPGESPITPPAEAEGQNETASSTNAAENPPSSPSAGSGQALNQGGIKINFGEVVINEFVCDPADDEVEWIELYNKTSQEIDLRDWWLEDGSKSKTKLDGLIGLSGPSRYKVIDKPAGNLNNGGDMIVLYDSAGKIIDQAVYGNWPDGNLSDNAPLARDPWSTARKFDGYNTYNNLNDFAVTIKPTKGFSNLIQTEDEVSAEAKAGFDFTSDIYLSEILPNPVGDDSKLEYIEIFNAGARDANLTGWSLSNEDDKKVFLEEAATGTIMKAGEYLVLSRPKTKIVLHNDQGEVKLFQPLADQAWQTVKYKGVKEGWSYNLKNLPLLGGNSKAEWAWSETQTPGAAYTLEAVRQALEVEFSFPEIVLTGQPVVFDSSDTSGSDGATLKYAWDFGDGFKNILANPEHTFFKTGIYKVKLAVSDGQETVEKVKSVKAVNGDGEFNLDMETTANPPNPPAAGAGQALYQGGAIVINEIFPDPAGADTGREWLELKNQSSEKINLINWRLENSNGKYKFKNDLWLKAENFYLLGNKESKLALKNSFDIVSLYSNLDELVDQAEYAAAVQGEAYARGENGKWFWTTKATPVRENVISLSDSQGASLTKASAADSPADSYIETALEKIRELEIGSLVEVRGAVAVLPGILGAQIFYIISSSSGLQIYSYKKDFPALKVGDDIEILGELAQAQGELRIKTKTKNDISIKGHNLAPAPLTLSCDEVSEENIGGLISVSGEITDKKSYTLFLDDGSSEILVYFKKAAGINTKSLMPGQSVRVTGILSQTQNGLRLMPRFQEDIVKTDQADGLAPQVLGEVAENQAWAVAERDKKIELFKYLLIIAGGVIIVLAGLFIKIARKK